MVLELVQACTIRDEPIHAVLELVHACSICNEPIHMDPELVQACTNLKGAVTKQPLKFKKLLVDYMKSTNNFFVFLSKKGPEGPFSLV